MRLKRKSKSKSTFIGIYDDNDEEIHLNQKLEHEDGWIVIVIQLSHGEYTGKVLNFCKPSLCDIYYSLNNGKKYTIIKTPNNEKNN